MAFEHFCWSINSFTVKEVILFIRIFSKPHISQHITPKNCLLSSDLIINIVFVFFSSQFTALANPAVKDFNVYPWKWKKPWHFSVTNNYKIMQKFHELVRRFSDKPSRCLLFLFGKANIVQRVLKQVEGLSSHVWREFFVFPPLIQVFWSQAFSVCGCIFFLSSYDWLVPLVVFLWSSPMLLRMTVIRKSF